MFNWRTQARVLTLEGISGFRVENQPHHTDNFTMTVKTDDRCRLESPELFKPNTPYEAEVVDGRVTLIELASAEVPLVQPILTPEGFIMLPAKVTRESIRRAIRADRDAL
jgi:hypothetical protein